MRARRPGIAAAAPVPGIERIEAQGPRWHFRPAGTATEVSWTYCFQTDGPTRRWAVALLVAPFFPAAMAERLKRLTIACGRHRHNN